MQTLVSGSFIGPLSKPAQIVLQLNAKDADSSSFDQILVLDCQAQLRLFPPIKAPTIPRTNFH